MAHTYINIYRNHHTSCNCCVVPSCMLTQPAAIMNNAERIMHSSTLPQCLQRIRPKHLQWCPCNNGGVNEMVALTFRLPSRQCPRWLLCVLAWLRSSHTPHRRSTELNRGSHIRHVRTCVERSQVDKLILHNWQKHGNFQSLHLVWGVLWITCSPVHGSCTEHKQEHNWIMRQSYIATYKWAMCVCSYRSWAT